MIAPLSSNLVNSAVNSNGLQTALQRLASGKRINSAQDDAAGQAILESLNSQATGLQQAQSNTQDALGVADIAGGALSQITDSLQRMRELAVQAANGGVYGAGDLKSLQSEVNQISQGIGDTLAQTNYSGQALLDGSFNATVQSGPNAGQTQALNLPNASPTALGIANLDISTPANASNAISALDAAINQIGAAQGTLGGNESALQASADVNATAYVSTAATAGQLGDTDYAATSAQLSQEKLKNQLALKAVAMYNAMQSDTLALFKKSP
jgi:flagellin